MENYHLKMMDIIKNLGSKKTLLMHSCCAPCSSYPIEILSKYFDISILFYNPNITDSEEYFKRKDELFKFIDETKLSIKVLEENYDTTEFFSAIKGYEDIHEGGERCFKCYYLRLEKTAKTAKEKGFDFFTTALSISPYKNSLKLNEFGKALEEKYGIKYLYSDFKKNNGYKRSIELSEIYHLYRQDYCGCIFSKKERENALKLNK